MWCSWVCPKNGVKHQTQWLIIRWSQLKLHFLRANLFSDIHPYHILGISWLKLYLLYPLHSYPDYIHPHYIPIVAGLIPHKCRASEDPFTMTTEGQWKYVGTGNGAYENAPQQLETLRTDPWNWEDLKLSKNYPKWKYPDMFFGGILQISSIESEHIGTKDWKIWLLWGHINQAITAPKVQSVAYVGEGVGSWDRAEVTAYKGISVQGGPVERTVTGAMGDFTNHQTWSLNWATKLVVIIMGISWGLLPFGISNCQVYLAEI